MCINELVFQRDAAGCDHDVAEHGQPSGGVHRPHHEEVGKGEPCARHIEHTACVAREHACTMTCHQARGTHSRSVPWVPSINDSPTYPNMLLYQ